MAETTIYDFLETNDIKKAVGKKIRITAGRTSLTDEIQRAVRGETVFILKTIKGLIIKMSLKEEKMNFLPNCPKGKHLFCIIAGKTNIYLDSGVYII